MSQCIICNNEAIFNLEYINSLFEGGLCEEHNFIHIENINDCKNENYIHDELNSVLLILLIISDNQFRCTSFFNYECANKISEKIKNLSYVSSELYFLAIKGFKQIISLIYGSIRNAIDTNYMGRLKVDKFCDVIKKSKFISYQTNNNIP